MRVFAFIVLALFANAQSPTSSSSFTLTPTSTASPTFSMSSQPSKSSSASPNITISSQPTRTSTASPTLSMSSRPSRTSSASPNTTFSSRPTRTSSASPSFSRSPKPSLDFNTRSVSYTTPPSITPSSLGSAQPSPSALSTISSQATVSVTPSQTPSQSVTRTPFCPYAVDKFLDPDKDCNGKTYGAIVAGLFWSAFFMYVVWLIPACGFTSCILDCLPLGVSCCSHRPSCLAISTIFFPPFLPFALLYALLMSVIPLIYRVYTTFTRSAIALARSVVPPPPPPFPEKCFPDTNCPVCLSSEEKYYVCLPCGHFACTDCITRLQIGIPPGLLPNFHCPTCRTSYSPGSQRTCSRAEVLVLEKRAAAAQASTGGAIAAPDIRLTINDPTD